MNKERLELFFFFYSATEPQHKKMLKKWKGMESFAL